jgi:hypothetical protein
MDVETLQAFATAISKGSGAKSKTLLHISATQGEL